ncbi:MAG: PVC-type heme-binding CxxCH protein [Planctomycetaceae bacterium]
MFQHKAWLIGMTLLCSRTIDAANPVEVSSPLAPEESLKHFQLDDGLTIELVACEPEIVDPVAMAFGADGSLWVVEMRDYPTPLKSGPSSKIKRLWDQDGDGRFETATIFADHLLFPTGLLPWKDGLIVTLAGEIAFFADRDGDGRAEFKETWFTGFAQENSQLRHNHPTLGPDGYIYVANGLRGGTVVPAKPEWKEKNSPVSLQGFDFRFDPETGKCEAISGNGQFGLTFDDWGNRFVCSNRNPCQHVVLENWHLQLNPQVAVKAVMHDVAAAGENSRIYPVSKFWTTSQQHAGQFTAACGVTIFRGDGLGNDYDGNVFVCDPTGNLVHREVMLPHGATFRSQSPYQNREFLATPDTWCRPVNLAHGPDGGLYVVDMYRAVIEHPDWVPAELKNRPDERNGDDRGRIYRIISQERAAKRLVKDQRLDETTTSEQAVLLSHPNAWQRDTAARLLSENGSDFAFRSLLDVIHGNATPPAKVSAICLCQSFAPERFYRPEHIENEPNPRVLEAWLVKDSKTRHFLSNLDSRLRDQISDRLLTGSDDARVKFQQALWIAGEVNPDADFVDTGRLFPIMEQGLVDPWLRIAALLSVRKNGSEDLRDYLKLPANGDSGERLVEFLEEMSAVISVRAEDKNISAAFHQALSDSAPRDRSWAVIRGLAIGQQRRGKSWQDLATAQSAKVQMKLSRVAKEAAHRAAAADSTAVERLAALRLLKFLIDLAAVPALLETAMTNPNRPFVWPRSTASSVTILPKSPRNCWKHFPGRLRRLNGPCWMCCWPTTIAPKACWTPWKPRRCA